MANIRKKIHYLIKTLSVVIEELKQGIVAIAAKVRRYQKRVDKFRQNRLFQNNQRQFYRELNKFWEDLWSELIDHNRDAKWLKDLQSEFNVTKQEKVDITKEILKKILQSWS